MAEGTTTAYAVIREALALMNSMIESGEKHSPDSKQSFRSALIALDACRKALEEGGQGRTALILLELQPSGSSDTRVRWVALCDGPEEALEEEGNAILTMSRSHYSTEIRRHDSGVEVLCFDGNNVNTAHFLLQSMQIRRLDLR